MALRMFCSETPASRSRLTTLSTTMSRQRVQPLVPGAGGVPDARDHQAGAGPVVELPVADRNGVARGHPAVANTLAGRTGSGRSVVDRLIVRVPAARSLPPTSPADCPAGTSWRELTLALRAAPSDTWLPDTRQIGARSARAAVRLSSPRNAGASRRSPPGLPVRGNSRNFSTSSSCSSGMMIPASARTCSAQRIGAPARSARAIESLGRAETRTPSPRSRSA